MQSDEDLAKLCDQARKNIPLQVVVATQDLSSLESLYPNALQAGALRAWHVSDRHIIAASTSETAMSYARSIGLDEQDGLFATAQELSVSELGEPCWTGGGDEPWRQDSIGNFLKETSAPRLLCESLPKPLE